MQKISAVMKKIEALILDFDGVVIESNNIKTEAFYEVFEQYPQFTKEMMDFHHAHVSLSRFAKFEHLLELLDRKGDITFRNELATDFSKRTKKKILSVPFVNGAEAFLRKMTSILPVYLASVTPDEELIYILEKRGLEKNFKKVYGCPPWTKTEAIKDILKQENVLPENTLLIGDSAGDQRAANSTGICFLARDSGLSFDQPLPQKFKDLNQISEHLNEFLS
jgi:beta-phosphoglucomutase-like phosphatase (HAD superfamily)